MQQNNQPRPGWGAVILLAGILLTAALLLPAITAGQQPTANQSTASNYWQAIDDNAERDYQPDYLHLAYAQPDQMGPLPQYPWIHDPLESIGHTIASYQHYGGNPYFHHGIDSRAPFGTDVFTYSGGQIVNIENYQPGNPLYWEVAVLDPDGFLWQYHHIDMPTIPQYIWDKYDEYLADPLNGGFVPPITHVGDIVEWPVFTFGEYFHHIHLNIYDGDGHYYNGFYLHEPLPDIQSPEILQIGLYQNGQILPGNEVQGNYSLYIRARDLIMHQQFYVPPNEIIYTVDAGPTETTWKFDGLPGGGNNQAYVTEFFIPPTCGDYECRDFYINLGFAVGPDRPFPTDPGQHTVTVTVRDFVGNEASADYTWTVLGPTFTPTATAPASDTPTATPSPTATATATSEPATSTPTTTATPSATPTSTPALGTSTLTPTATPTSTAASIATATSTATPGPTPVSHRLWLPIVINRGPDDDAPPLP